MPDGTSTKFKKLTQGEYDGRIRLKFLDQYLGDSPAGGAFGLTSIPRSWKVTKAQGQPMPAGYWVFMPGANMCWQANQEDGGKLRYWNADGLAKGGPDNWETFAFETVDENAYTVRIKNEVKGLYVRYVPPIFICDTGVRNSIALEVEFVD